MRFAAVGAAVAAVAACASTTAEALEYSRTASYEGHIVYRCHAEGRQYVNLMRLIDEEGLDLWARREGEIDVRLTPAQQELYPVISRRCDTHIADVEALVRESEAELLNPSKAPEGFHTVYHDLTELHAYYASLPATYPGLVSFTPSIGQSVEGRDIFAIAITSDNGRQKDSIYFQCQIHAREWITGAVCSYVVDQLLEGYSQNGTITSLLDTLVFHVVPVVNPDGYVHTWSGDRLWRKNRSLNAGSSCRGTDLNRNYNTHWGQGGSSTSPCSDTYMGVSVASEPEVQATVSHWKSIGNIIAAVDWHSYSQLILRPWGYARTDAPDEAQLKSLGDGMRAAIIASGGLQYTSQKSIDLYVTTGTGSDWFYDAEATQNNGGYRAAAFTFELRDLGRYGFQLPADQILPNGEEMFAAVVYLAENIRGNPIRV